jgi:DNA-binding NtrC family response regulator
MIGTRGSNGVRIWYGKGMSRGRVLVVDDEADVRRLVRELLERADYDVADAPDGRDALRALYTRSLSGTFSLSTLSRIP